jgi:uncharacterized protein
LKTIVGALASLSRRFPLSVIILAIGLTVLFGQFAGQVTIASGNEGFAPEGAEMAAAERIGEKFGEGSQESAIQIVLVDEGGGDVITVAGLQAAIDTAGVISRSDVGPKLSDRPERPGILHFLMGVEEAMAANGLTMDDMTDEMVKEYFRVSIDPERATPDEASFIIRLVSGDFDPGTTAASGGLVLAFVNSFDGDPEEAWNAQMAAERDMAAELEGIQTTLELRPFSFPLLLTGVDEFTEEVGRLFGMAFTVILVLLLFVYWLPSGRSGGWWISARRTVADALLSLLAVVMAIVWMQGIGYLLEQVGIITAFSAPTQIVPILMVALGIDYAIHLNSRYREEIGSGLSVDEAVGRAVRTVGISLVLATITTVIGFLTNLVNPVPALTDFGVLAAVGIASSFLLMLTFLPAVRIVADRRAQRRGTLPVGSLADHGNRLVPRLMQKLAVLALRAPVATLLVAIGLGAAGYYGFSQLETRFSFTDFLPEDSVYVETLEILQSEFGGGFGEQTMVLVEATEGRGIDAEVHNALVAANTSLPAVPDVSTLETVNGTFANALSPIEILGQMMALGPEMIPPSLLEAAAEVGLGEDLRVAPGSNVSLLYAAMLQVDPDNAARVIHFEGDRLDALLWDISTVAGERVTALRTGLDAAFDGVRDLGGSVVATSDNIIGDSVVIELTESQTRSLVITLVVAGLVLMISFLVESRRPFLGVITIAPVALVVLWTYGLMYALGIPFGPVTATLAALSIGIGVPFTIHIARRFQEERVAKDTIEEAMRGMMRHTGGALAGSAFTTIAGFGVLITASLVPFRQMGQVTSFAIALCLLAAVAVLPSMLALWDRYHRRREGARALLRENEPAAPSGRTP